MEITFTKPYRQQGEMRVDALVDGVKSGIVLRKSFGTGNWDAMCEGYFKVRGRKGPVFGYQFFAWEMSLKEAKKYLSTRWINLGKMYLTEHSVRCYDKKSYRDYGYRDFMPIEFLGAELQEGQQ